ncbi:uncharacterized protein PAC_07544 [Phialocephala subalpina]|uniref:Uncharacterized protein n=1 Tax=Phialocephala subalpina TaxID=576137 RepID=A0A1L7WY24_9HELO|nr:uncharacterized protein PAC_07544 [Phialocephala subalpina]
MSHTAENLEGGGPGEGDAPQTKAFEDMDVETENSNNSANPRDDTPASDTPTITQRYADAYAYAASHGIHIGPVPARSWTQVEYDSLFELVENAIRRRNRTLNKSDFENIAQQMDQLFEGPSGPIPSVVGMLRIVTSPRGHGRVGLLYCDYGFMGVYKFLPTADNHSTTGPDGLESSFTYVSSYLAELLPQ